MSLSHTTFMLELGYFGHVTWHATVSFPLYFSETCWWGCGLVIIDHLTSHLFAKHGGGGGGGGGGGWSCRSAHGTMIKTLTDCLRHMRLKHDNPLSPYDVFLYHVLEECGIKWQIEWLNFKHDKTYNYYFVFVCFVIFKRGTWKSCWNLKKTRTSKYLPKKNIFKLEDCHVPLRLLLHIRSALDDLFSFFIELC